MKKQTDGWVRWVAVSPSTATPLLPSTSVTKFALPGHENCTEKSHLSPEGTCAAQGYARASSLVRSSPSRRRTCHRPARGDERLIECVLGGCRDAVEGMVCSLRTAGLQEWARGLCAYLLQCLHALWCGGSRKKIDDKLWDGSPRIALRNVLDKGFLLVLAVRNEPKPGEKVVSSNILFRRRFVLQEQRRFSVSWPRFHQGWRKRALRGRPVAL